ncbi:MAG: transposase [Thermodesulfovibrionales bacterium]|nr:transposase [Thermodesulfovibrionales bacterium]
MPRIARAVATGFPHHVLQRGNNREKVFFDKKDREQYLSLLKKYSDKWDSPILAYCLMNNHVHLLTRPKEEESLYKMMQGVTLCYTQYINRKYKRTGRLWESRYHSCIVDKEQYLWAVAKYIEQNPTRAKIVKKVEDFPYSSARVHIDGVKDEVLGEDLFEEGQRKGYGGFIRGGIPEEERNRIRYSTRTGRPFGSEKFVRSMEKKLDRRFILKSPGRPRKKKGK